MVEKKSYLISRRQEGRKHDSYFEFHNEPDLDWYPATNTPAPTKTPVTGPCKMCGGPLPPQSGDGTPTPTPQPADLPASAASYVRELGSFASAVRTIQPKAVIVSGGVAYDNAPYPIGYTEDWLRSALAAGLGQKADVIAFHFYPKDWYVPLRFRTLDQKTAAVKAVVDSYPSGTRLLWANESGLTSLYEDLATPYANPTPAYTDPHVQAGQVVRMNAAGQGKGLTNQVWFNFKDLDDPNYRVYAHSGLISSAGAIKPSLEALLQYGREVSHGAPASPAGYPAGFDPGGWRGFTFRNAPTLPHRFISVLWSDAPGSTSNYTIPASRVKNLERIMDVYGNTIMTPQQVPANTDYMLTLTNSPVYLKWRVGFVDVDVDNVFYSYIDAMADRQVISGYADFTFRPFAEVTRGQAAKILVLMQGQGTNTAGGPHFWDVAPGSTFYEYVETAYNRGIISGYADGSFRPGNSVTRGQAAKMISQAAGFNDPIPAGRQTFEDVPSDNPFWEPIERIALRGIMSGYTCGVAPAPGCLSGKPYFLWQNNMTRGQLSKASVLAFGMTHPAAAHPTPTLITSLLPSGPTPVPGLPSAPQPVQTAAAPLSGPSGSSSSSVPGAQPSQPAQITGP